MSEVVPPATWTDRLAPCGVAGWERGRCLPGPRDAEPRPQGRGFEHWKLPNPCPPGFWCCCVVACLWLSSM